MPGITAGASPTPQHGGRRGQWGPLGAVSPHTPQKPSGQIPCQHYHYQNLNVFKPNSKRQQSIKDNNNIGTIYHTIEINKSKLSIIPSKSDLANMQYRSMITASEILK
jgi:hypothetical protein